MSNGEQPPRVHVQDPYVTPPAVNFGGTWYGLIPPDNPETGWLWFNTNTFGLYVYEDSNTWVQIGTNW